MTNPDPVAVNSMFGRIAGRYDVANRLLSFGLDTAWRRRLVGAVRRSYPAKILDLATGSGDVAFALAAALPSTTDILGMDFCLPMLAEAENKLKAIGKSVFPQVRFAPGDAQNLPLADATFDAVTISFGLRNLADRGRSLQEIRRVLRVGGRLFVLEFSQPWTWLRPFYYFYLRRLLPAIAGKVTGDRAAYEYLNASIATFPGRHALAEEIRAAGFTGVEFSTQSGCIVALHQAVRS